MKKILFVIGAVLTFSQTYAQKVYSNEEWANFTNNMAPFTHTASVPTISGGIAVVSSVMNLSGNSDVLITQYDKTGYMEWQTSFDGGYSGNDHGVQIVITPGGDLYIAASIEVSATNTNYGLLKYDSFGSLVWSEEWDGIGDFDGVADLILDGYGNIYLTGGSQAINSFSDFATVKYDEYGAFQWESFYDYDDLHDAGAKLSIVGSDLYVVGASASDLTTWDNATVVLDISDGTEVSSSRASIPGAGIDMPKGIVAGMGNTIYVTGYVEVSGNKNIQLLKINNTNNEIEWMETFDGGFEDEPSAIGLDSNGFIYVAGFTERANGTQDYITLKYDENGTQQWAKKYRAEGPTNNSVATGIGVNPDGSLFVSGTTEEDGGRFFNTIYYDSSGNIKDVMKHHDLSGLYESPKIALDGGDVYLTGIRNTSGVLALTAIRYTISERPLEITEVTSVPSHISNEVIIAFNKDVVNAAIIDSTELTFGSLSIFVGDSIIDSLELAYPLLDWEEVMTYKIFPRMTTADSLSTSRNGHEVNVQPFWATLLLLVDREDEVDVIDSLTGKFLNCIDFVQTNALFSTTSDDPLFGNQEALVSSTYPDGHINIEDAWAIETGKSNIKVGVYDTGIKYDHEDFGGAYACTDCKVKNGYDYLNNISFLNIPNAGDEITGGSNNGHGTKTAGIIGAIRNNDLSMAGVGGGNWPYANSGEGVQVDPLDPATENIGVSLYGFRIFNSSNIATLTDVCNALVEGTVSSPNGFGYGIDIMNNSWRMNLEQPFQQNALLMRNCQREIFRNQTVHVASRGNNVGDDLYFPSEADREFWVVNVGGSTTAGNLHSQSGYAGNMDLIAPFPTELITTVSNASTTANTTFSGTSASAAFVSGTAGLMLSHINDQPQTPNNLAPDDVEFLLQRYAKDRNDVTSPGLGYTNGYDDRTGWGLLDAGNTLEHIDRSSYIVKHYELETTLDLTGLTPVSAERFIRNNSGLGGDDYLCDIYTVTFNIPNDLEVGDVILDYWPLNSYTTMYRADQPLTFIDREYQCNVTNMTQSTGTIQATVVYVVQNLTTGAWQNYWMPASQGQTIRVGYTLHIQSNYASVDENTNNIAGLSCYPNPTNGELNLNFVLKENADVSFEVVDVNGALLHRSIQQSYPLGQQNINLNVNSWASGVYFVKLNCNNEISYAKFIKH